MTEMPTPPPLLQVADLRVTLPTARGWAQALRGVSLRMERGQTVGLIGESGCGKSLTALALMGLLPDHAQVAGSIQFEARELLTLPARQRRALRGARRCLRQRFARARLGLGGELALGKTHPAADGSDRILFLNLLPNGGQGNSIVESPAASISTGGWASRSARTAFSASRSTWRESCQPARPNSRITASRNPFDPAVRNADHALLTAMPASAHKLGKMSVDATREDEAPGFYPALSR